MEMTAQLWTVAKRVLFYLMVIAIVVISIFPFYYAILTSFKSGTDLYRITYWPTSLSLENYQSVFTQGSFVRNLANSVVVATLVVALALLMAVTAAYALSRVRFHGRGLLILQSTLEKGAIKLKAESPDLETATIEWNSH